MSMVVFLMIMAVSHCLFHSGTLGGGREEKFIPNRTFYLTTTIFLTAVNDSRAAPSSASVGLALIR